MDVKSKYWGLVGGTHNSLPVTSKGLRRNWEQGTEEIPPVKEMGQDIPGPGPCQGKQPGAADILGAFPHLRWLEPAVLPRSSHLCCLTPQV